MRPKIIILNGSLGQQFGNTSVLVARAREILQGEADVEELLLGQEGPKEGWEAKLRKAQAFVLATGTYWDSWGSPMQKFLEDVTHLEASVCWMGKPAAVLVTAHSVGGKGVLSRLQGVLNTLGCSIPPMSGVVYSLAGHLALRADSDFAEDFWQLEDVSSVAHNLLEALKPSPKYETWPVDHQDPRRRWL